MKSSRLLRTTALAMGGLLAVAALQGCNKSGSAAGGESGADQADASGPNGYAPTGAPAQAAPSGGSGGGHASRRGGYASEGGGGGGYYQNAGYYVDQAPPPIPQYDQPSPPGDGYYWTPGYWGWSNEDSDYYWVPGTWVQPPNPGLYWTPGYWAFVNGAYAFYAGYWGPTVGYYGGVDYGWGYNGRGYYGGRWQNNQFAYNSALNNLGAVHVTNVYRQNETNWTNNRTSYSGGPHGLRVAPTPEQISATQARHVEPTSGQRAQVTAAQHNPELRAGANRGAPPVVATARPGAFQGPGVVTQVKATSHYTPPAHIQAARQPPLAASAVAPGRGGPSAQVVQPPAQRGPEAGPAAMHGAAPQANGGPPNRPAETRPGPEAHPAPEARPVPQARPAPEARPVPQARPAPEARSVPQARVVPEARPVPQSRPTPEVRAAPAYHPAPQVRAAPAARPEMARPTPEARPAPAPRPEVRAAPPPQMHAAPAPRPAPPARPEERKPDAR